MREKSRRVVVAADAAAGALGFRPGYPIAQAVASVPDLVVVDAEPGLDRDELDHLAAWCLRYGPVVQADPPDGIFLDVEGASHLLGGEAALLADLLGRLAKAGLAARAAIAGTPGAAWALARHCGAAIVPSGGEADALADLPVAALRLDSETCRGLRLLGIDRIGQLAAYPRAGIVRRFGQEVVRRLDRARGNAPEPLVPLLPRRAAQSRIAFAEPLCHLEGIEAALRRLAGQLCRELAGRDEGVRRLDAVFVRVDGRPLGIRVATSMPSRDPDHLLRLLGERLGGIDPGFGIDEIVLVAAEAERLPARQAEASSLDPAASATHRLAPLIDRLAVRLGTERVYRLSPVESRFPERSVRRIPPLAAATGASWPRGLPRPSRIIDPPEPVTAVALLPDNPPVFFVWRHVRHIVRLADGPERVRGEWWQTDSETASLRDYYRVEDEAGSRFWLFRDAPPAEDTRWWMHGRFV